MTSELDPGSQTLPTPDPPSLECTFCPLFPPWELFQGCGLERVRRRWDHLDCVRNNPVKVSTYKLVKILVGQYGDLFILQPPKADLIYRFPCWLKLPPTNLKWSASFFSLSLPFVHGVHFQISPRELPRSHTNTQIASGEAHVTRTIITCSQQPCEWTILEGVSSPRDGKLFL